MMKALKRIFMVFMLLVLLAAGYIAAFAYSDELATDVAYLECALIKADGEGMTFDKAFELYGPVNYARLRNNWIEQRIVLHWVDDRNISTSGLSTSIYLRESTLEYSGYDYEHRRFRRFNRETLVYRSEAREMSESANLWYIERQCKTISKDVFESKRLRHANQTLSRQKI